jgi:xanthine dehydrogenase accessory factor
MKRMLMNNDLIVVRGAGQLGSAVVQKFYRSGKRLLVLEKEAPTTLFGSVSLASAVYTQTSQVEDICARTIPNVRYLMSAWQDGVVPILIDPSMRRLGNLRPTCIIDATSSHCNDAMHPSKAPITLALGPGFIAGQEVDAVIDTTAGHNQGQIIFEGQLEKIYETSLQANGQWMLTSPCRGPIFHRNQVSIGSLVQKDQLLFILAGESIYAPVKGIVRGLLPNACTALAGQKVALIDPNLSLPFTRIASQARCIAGSALEAFLYLQANRPTPLHRLSTGPYARRR